MKIYDCFTFYNELDLLEIRLEELYDHVDHFVLVEANTTFTNLSKQFLFDENKERYARFLNKIIHVKVENMPHSSDPWINERFQRDQILQGISTTDSSDLIIVSDIDEILRSEAVQYMRNSMKNQFALRMTLHNFKFNYMKVNPDRYAIWGLAARRSLFNNTTPENFRRSRLNFIGYPYQYSNDDFEIIEHGGWHFGYLGDNTDIEIKARSTSHQAPNLEESIAKINVKESIAQRTSLDLTGSDKYTIVEIDSYFPKIIVNNRNKYQKYILDNPETTAMSLLPAYPYNT